MLVVESDNEDDVQIITLDADHPFHCLPTMPQHASRGDEGLSYGEMADALFHEQLNAIVLAGLSSESPKICVATYTLPKW